MSTHAADDDRERGTRRAHAGVETVESYEDEGSVVLFDAENPLAWVEATRAVRLREAV